MNINIQDVQLVQGPGDLPGYLRAYVNATATEGAKSVVEEFVIGRQVVGRQIVRDAQGNLLTTDGRAIALDAVLVGVAYPWQYEVVMQDFRAEIVKVLQETMRRRLDTNWGGDKEELRVKLSLGDRTGLPPLVLQLQGLVV